MICGGKRVGRSLYVHQDAIRYQPIHEAARVRRAADRIGEAYHDASVQWNVAKITARSVTLLWYPQFETHPHPPLEHAWRCRADGVVAHDDYTRRTSRPILHRKELMVAPWHPQRAAWAALTKAEEAAGLYADPARIGTSKAWQELLDSKGLVYNGHMLIKV